MLMILLIQATVEVAVHSEEVCLSESQSA